MEIHLTDSELVSTDATDVSAAVGVKVGSSLCRSEPRAPSPGVDAIAAAGAATGDGACGVLDSSISAAKEEDIGGEVAWTMG